MSYGRDLGRDMNVNGACSSSQSRSTSIHPCSSHLYCYSFSSNYGRHTVRYEMAPNLNHTIFTGTKIKTGRTSQTRTRQFRMVHGHGSILPKSGYWWCCEEGANKTDIVKPGQPDLRRRPGRRLVRAKPLLQRAVVRT